LLGSEPVDVRECTNAVAISGLTSESASTPLAAANELKRDHVGTVRLTLAVEVHPQIAARQFLTSVSSAAQDSSVRVATSGGKAPHAGVIRFAADFSMPARPTQCDAASNLSTSDL
jgi:hypothetical protein